MKSHLNSKPVLAIDLDGTLTSVDTLYESVLRLLFVKPFLVLFFPFWLLAGKAAFKAKISSMIPFNPEYIPYNTDLIEWVRHEKAQNREIALCTASDISIAKAVSAHLGIFDHVIGSDGKVNNSGLDKRAILDSRFGVRGYDYAGNSIDDVDVWAGSNKAIFVAVSEKVESKALQVCHVVKRFTGPPKSNVAVTTIKPGLIDSPMTVDFNKFFLWVMPTYAAKKIVKGIDAGKYFIYVPGFWRLIMIVFKLIPEVIFVRISSLTSGAK